VSAVAPSAAPPGRRRTVLVAASLLAGIAMLVLIGVITPWRLLVERVATIPPWGWVAATLGMSGTYALRAGRLRAEWLWKLRPMGLGYLECLRITLMHNAAINLLPMRSGEASYAFLLHRRWGVPIGEAAASLLWLRLQDAMVLGVLGLAILVPAPLGWRVVFAAGAIVVAATLVPALVRHVHVHARWRRARAHGRASAGARRGWHLLAKIAGAFRASRGGRAAWGFAVSNWVLKLGVVGALVAPLAGLSLGAGISGALGGELAAVLPVQAPAGVGTYEAGVVLGAAARADNRTLVVGAALAVHALMIVVALGTALAFSLLVRTDPRAEEERPTP
jgi:uncharacterized membrane protein YbhN (UPF0104 family)